MGAHVDFAKIFGEIRTAVANGFCPHCGAMLNEKVPYDTEVRCKYCGGLFLAKKMLSEPDKRTIEALVDNVLSKYSSLLATAMKEQEERVREVLVQYAERCIEQAGQFYKRLQRLPTVEELTSLMEDSTSKVLKVLSELGEKVDRLLELLDASSFNVTLAFINGPSFTFNLAKGPLVIFRDPERRDAPVLIEHSKEVLDTGLRDLMVSRRLPTREGHVKLFLDGGRVYIEDLGSTNGVLVNKQRIPPRSPKPLKSGDRVKLSSLTKFIITYG